MAKKKTNQQKKYILINTEFALDEVILIGTIEEIKDELASIIEDSEECENYKVYEIGNEYSVSAEPIGWNIELSFDGE